MPVCYNCKVELCEMMKTNTPEAIKKAIIETRKKGPLPTTTSGCLPLLWQAVLSYRATNLTEVVHQLVKSGVDVNERVDNYKELKGLRLLEVLANSKNKSSWKIDIEFAKLLIHNGAEIEPDYYIQDHSALYFALIQNNVDFIEMLVVNGAQMIGPEWARESPLVYACRSNHANKLVPLFVYAGVDVTKMGLYFQNPMHYLSSNKLAKKSPALAEMLIARGCPFDDPDMYDETPLFKAAQNADYELVEYLLKLGAEVNAKNCKGLTPLHGACKCNREKLMRLLYEYGANVNAVDFDRKSPLSYVRPETKPSNLGPLVMMIRLIAMEKHKGNRLSKDNMSTIQSRSLLQKHYLFCLAELQKMKEIQFYPNFTFYDLLDWPRNREQLVGLLDETADFLESFKKYNRKATFPCYNVDLDYVITSAVKEREERASNYNSPSYNSMQNHWLPPGWWAAQKKVGRKVVI